MAENLFLRRHWLSTKSARFAGAVTLPRELPSCQFEIYMCLRRFFAMGFGIGVVTGNRTPLECGLG